VAPADCFTPSPRIVRPWHLCRAHVAWQFFLDVSFLFSPPPYTFAPTRVRTYRRGCVVTPQPYTPSLLIVLRLARVWAIAAGPIYVTRLSALASS
jgi:hypothetical protein